MMQRLLGRLPARLHRRPAAPTVAATAAASRWQALSEAGGGDSWLATGLAGDSRWLGLGALADRRWQRQLAASRRWAVAGALAGGSAALALFAPAQWLADAVAGATHQQLLLAEAQGSVWTGSAVAVLTAGPGSRDAAALPGRLNWRLRPMAPTDGLGLVLHLEQACCLAGPLALQIRPGLARWTVTLRPPTNASAATPAGGIGQWPTAWIAGLGTPWNSLQFKGVMQLSSPGLTISSSAGRVHLDGQMSVELHDLSSRLSPLPSLGSYRLLVQGQAPGSASGASGGAVGPASGAADGAGRAPLRLETLAGPLQLQGEGQWSGGRLRFRGEAHADPGHDSALANLLNIIGRRHGARSVISIG